MARTVEFRNNNMVTIDNKGGHGEHTNTFAELESNLPTHGKMQTCRIAQMRAC